MFRISSVRDLRVWAANSFPDLDDAPCERLAQAIWLRADFPHPVNNTPLDEYLGTIGTEWCYEQALEEAR